LQLKFWTALVEHLAEAAPQIRPAKPGPYHWLNTSIGRSGFGLNITANTREERLGVELYLSGSEAKRRFAELLPQKDEIEAALGFTLDWRELPEKTASRIVAWYSDASLEDESRWGDYQAWLTQTLVAMEQVLRPRIKWMP
jgi:hypothetical protein